ncbi:MAG: hypothetical protein CBC65_001250 [Rhodothermaceae bacterium TMED105]|jgi:hypothetical protein|nr:MAG: hypothetical protein CBC65_001250 [Rhodothermaceae bacterium TMED105]
MTSRKSRKSRKSQKSPNRSTHSSSFAAKLAVFMLDNARNEVIFSKTSGFSSQSKEAFGVLPFLHMNISETMFRSMLKNGVEPQKNVISKACRQKGLESALKAVNFNCNSQSLAGVETLADALIHSIHDKYSKRRNGHRRLGVIQKAMEWQVSNGVIPSTSIAWTR